MVAILSSQDDITPDKADHSHSLRQELIALRISATEHFFRIGEILKEVRDNQYWIVEGHPSFESYIADPEIGIKRSTAYHAIKLIETFPQRELLSEIPVSKLIMIAPYVKEENKLELIAAAKSLSRSDLRQELVSHGFEPERKTEPQMPKIYKCNVCHNIKGVRWDDLCHCGITPAQIDHIGRIIDRVEFGEEVEHE